MIKRIEKSTIELADKLAKLEKSLFETAWDSVVINNKINIGEFVYWVCLLYTSDAADEL